MKKTILSLLLLSNFLFGDAKTYVGISAGIAEENFTSADATSSSNIINLKLGYGERELYSVAIGIEYLKNESKIFSTGVDNDGDKFAFNLELVKAFNLSKYIIPFVNLGFGAGYLEIDRAIDDKISFGSFNLGAGVLIPINDDFDFEFGYKYKSLSYEGLDLIATKEVHTSKSTSPYFGFNVRY